MVIGYETYAQVVVNSMLLQDSDHDPRDCGLATMVMKGDYPPLVIEDGRITGVELEGIDE